MLHDHFNPGGIPLKYEAPYLAAAGIILGKAGYAWSHAGAEWHKQTRYRIAVTGAFILLTGCILVLMKTTHLDRVWHILALLPLPGYLTVPPHRLPAPP